MFSLDVKWCNSKPLFQYFLVTSRENSNLENWSNLQNKCFQGQGWREVRGGGGEDGEGRG